MKFGFMDGGSNPLTPINASSVRSVNLYPEITGVGNPKANPIDRPTPGRHVLSTVSASSIDCLFDDGSATPGLQVSVQGRCFGLAQSLFFEIVSSAPNTIAIIQWGTVAPSVLPGQQSTIASNGDSGHQLAIASGGNGYIFDLRTSAFGLITATGFPQGSIGNIVYLDGYFIALNYTDSTFQLSALDDGTLWDALDVAQRSDASDRLTSLYVYHNELWLFGSLTTEVWYDSGNSLFPFTRVQGSLMQIGTIYPWTIQVLGDALFFTGQEHSQGQANVWRTTDYHPMVVSNQAVNNAIVATDTTVDVLRAWTYEDSGHAFYILRLPTGTSWGYDLTCQLWHERGIHIQAGAVDAFDPDPVRCHVYQFGMHIVGDSSTGTIWQQSNSFLADQVAA